jgi:UDP-N-acetylmuramoyl-L-alanyl-D-glutamate--2,6-diaminopimelate ligase
MHAAVTGVTHDSAAVRKGDLYAALPGARRHGAGSWTRPAPPARWRSSPTTARRSRPVLPLLVVTDPRAALGPIASAVYGDPTGRLPVIGITGTAGKTSTAYLVESGLRAAGHITCMIGTVETRVADVVIDSVRTTPEATDLHALFAAALERGATAAVMEVSSHALSYGRVGGVSFAVGGWTNFGLDHLDFHADVDDYFAAKARLFDGRCRAGVLNLDDRRCVGCRARPGDVLPPPATGGDLARGRRDPEGSCRASPRSAPTASGWPRMVALPGLHNVANARCSPSPAWSKRGGSCYGRQGCQRVPGRAGAAGAGGRSGRSSAWSTTHTSRTRSSPRSPRSAISVPSGRPDRAGG